MIDPIPITCPRCGETYTLAEAVAQPVLDAAVDVRLAQERQRLTAEAEKQAQERLFPRLTALQQELAEVRCRLTESEKAELEARRHRRELEDAKRALELTVERRVEAQCETIREAARRERDEVYQLSLAERDKLIADMRRDIEELRRHGQVLPPQVTGKLLELDLENLLRCTNPTDCIEAVRPGQQGADVLQHVIGPNGRTAGVIVYERKDTKTWSSEWLPKLREDMRRCGGQVAVLVTSALPPAVETFERVENVWVTSPKCVAPLSKALRSGLVALAMARLTSEGRESKADYLWRYITSDAFASRISLIVESCVSLHEGIESEKKYLGKTWARQCKHIEHLFDGAGQMWGDLQAIAGRSLPQVEGLTVDEPDAPEPEEGEEEAAG